MEALAPAPSLFLTASRARHRALRARSVALRRLRPILLTLFAGLACACGGGAAEVRSASSHSTSPAFHPSDPATSSAEGRTERENAAPNETVAAERAKPFKERVLGRWQAKNDAGKVIREFDGDLEATYENGRLVYKIHYEVVKDDGNEVTLRRTGKDEVSNQGVKGEYKILFKNDNTIEIRDPDIKDPKKATVLILERSMVRAKAVPVGSPK